jgi:hypothetical protein
MTAATELDARELLAGRLTEAELAGHAGVAVR